MKEIRGVWTVAAALACGCAMVLGVNPDDYSLVCEPGQRRCDGKTAQHCGENGLWQDELECVTCVNSECIAGQGGQGGQGANSTGTAGAGGTGSGGSGGGSTCVPDGQQCSSNSQCCSQVCLSGVCSVPPSCDGLPTTCGPSGDESCCGSEVVTGGTYNRSNNPVYPATVGDFRLDRFEITVGRFRAFVGAYPGSKPSAGAGEYAMIPATGWDSGWGTNLPVDQAALTASVKCDIDQTWTDVPGASENLPMNCITWYEAFAFCVWDGGRLPTEAEWNYAAAGGSEQREYPWSNPPNSTAIDPSYAVYDCTGDGSPAQNCAFTDILKVGSKAPKGDGKWGQADLAGSMEEWVLDWHSEPYQWNPCNFCANTQESGSGRELRGGRWNSQPLHLLSSNRDANPPMNRHSYIGARCARMP